MKKLLGLALFAFGGYSSAGPGDYLYFPELAKEVLAGNALSFRQLLAQAHETPPGEGLEELAELSSRFVRLDPAGFLKAQDATGGCFGVSFMGPGFVDNEAAKVRERSLRRKALESVGDPTLASAQQRCLAELAGT